MSLYAELRDLADRSMVYAAHPMRLLVELLPGPHLTIDAGFGGCKGIARNRRYGSALKTHLGRLLRADVVVLLIGQSGRPVIVSLILKHRLALYCILVEGMTQEETIQVLDRTEWDTDCSLRDSLRAVEHCVKT
jgi:hypothetical protein